MNRSGPAQALETWAAAQLARLAPAERRRLARKLAVEVRRDQQKRIAAQQNPDGSAYAPRKPRAEARNGRIRLKIPVWQTASRQALTYSCYGKRRRNWLYGPQRPHCPRSPVRFTGFCGPTRPAGALSALRTAGIYPRITRKNPQPADRASYGLERI